jgi:hypothetical protein
LPGKRSLAAKECRGQEDNRNQLFHGFSSVIARLGGSLIDISIIVRPLYLEEYLLDVLWMVRLKSKAEVSPVAERLIF